MVLSLKSAQKTWIPMEVEYHKATHYKLNASCLDNETKHVLCKNRDVLQENDYGYVRTFSNKVKFGDKLCSSGRVSYL